MKRKFKVRLTKRELRLQKEMSYMYIYFNELLKIINETITDDSVKLELISKVNEHITNYRKQFMSFGVLSLICNHNIYM